MVATCLWALRPAATQRYLEHRRGSKRLMPNLKVIPSALTVAGSDSGGGAGIQADLKTFAALGVHGTSVVTCLTAQNPKRVFGIEPASPKSIRQQLTAVFAAMPP